MDSPTKRNPGHAAAAIVAAWAIMPAGPAPAAAPQQSAAPPEQTILHLTQSAERRLPRDRLKVELRAEETAADPQKVEAAINTRMRKALAEAHRAAGIEVETGSYSVYRATPANAAPRWTGRQALMLTGPDAGELLKLAGRLQADGLLMSNLVYQVSPKAVRSAEDALTAEALATLRRRAVAIAQQLHLAVVGYREVTVGNAGTDGGPRPLFAMQARAAMPAPVGAAGEATVEVTVSADVLLGPTAR
jgi:predicted secreted protein